jgi:hypothetical protein
MSERGPESQPVQPPVNIGEVLPNFLEIAQDRRGARLSFEVIPSTYGDLYFDLSQYRDGTTRWVTNHGEVLVTIDIKSGIVLSIDAEAQEKLIQGNPDIYDMGMKAYNESFKSDD